jgi:hypothetical protein
MRSSEEMVELAQTEHSAALEGRCGRLLRPVRDREGRSRFNEDVRILREITNLGRKMFLVEFSDGATTFLFPDELEIP